MVEVDGRPFKAAQMNILILTMDHMIMCNVEVVKSYVVPTENCNLSLELVLTTDLISVIAPKKHSKNQSLGWC